MGRFPSSCSSRRARALLSLAACPSTPIHGRIPYININRTSDLVKKQLTRPVEPPTGERRVLLGVLGGPGAPRAVAATAASAPLTSNWNYSTWFAAGLPRRGRRRVIDEVKQAESQFENGLGKPTSVDELMRDRVVRCTLVSTPAFARTVKKLIRIQPRVQRHYGQRLCNLRRMLLTRASGRTNSNSLTSRLHSLGRANSRSGRCLAKNPLFDSKSRILAKHASKNVRKTVKNVPKTARFGSISVEKNAEKLTPGPQIPARDAAARKSPAGSELRVKCPA